MPKHGGERGNFQTAPENLIICVSKAFGGLVGGVPLTQMALQLKAFKKTSCNSSKMPFESNDITLKGLRNAHVARVLTPLSCYATFFKGLWLKISACLSPIKLHLSSKKSVSVAFTRKNIKQYPLVLGGHTLQYVCAQRFLGILIDGNLSWAPVVKRLCTRISAVLDCQVSCR